MRGRKEHGDDLLHDPLQGSLIGSRGCFDDPSDSITLGYISHGSIEWLFPTNRNLLSAFLHVVQPLRHFNGEIAFDLLHCTT